MQGRPVDPSLGLTVLALFACMALAGCVAAPRPLDVVPRRAVEFDTTALTGILGRSVDEGDVNYPALCGDSGFSELVASTAAVDLARATPSERLSTLINGYNVLALESVLAGGNPSTLFGRYGFFMRTRHPFAGEAITLWDLEHGRIRPLGEPRIHFALVCASSSCPKLRSEAYSPAADALERQLDAAARAFVNDPTRNRFDATAGTASVSAIFDWYREDFETPERSLAEYIAGFVDDADVASALRSGELELDFVPYDWSLNGTPPGPDGRCAARP